MAMNKGTPLFPMQGKKAETEKSGNKVVEKPWKVLIVDDEKEVHSVSKLALNGVTFAGRPLEFLHAYSGAEAREVFEKEDDIALTLLDVVMETDNAGLEVVEHVRNTLKNRMTRIVLRTGQPGQAPEKTVIVKYDINDYKEKTELTSQKLFTLIQASLRSYRDMVALEKSQEGLRKIIDASATLFSLNSMKQFADGALEQMLSILRVGKNDSFYGQSVDSLAACKRGLNFNIIAGTGRYKVESGKDHGLSALPTEALEHLQIAATQKDGHVFSDEHIVSYHKGREDHENLLYVKGNLDYDHIDKNLVELYARNVGIAFENIELHQQVEETQREIVYRLGEACETRSMETGNHLKRVSEITKLIAQEYGLTEDESEKLRYASPLHDVGKIGIPDAILNKPGKHTEEEWEIMKTHSQLGYNMLAGSNKPILKAGALIALEHHEKWDGSGYPNGKKGEDIHIYGRIAAIADVYDALGSVRCYKDPWPLGEIYTFVKSQRGKHFQPELVDVLTNNLDKVENILAVYKDNFNNK